MSDRQKCICCNEPYEPLIHVDDLKVGLRHNQVTDKTTLYGMTDDKTFRINYEVEYCQCVAET